MGESRTELISWLNDLLSIGYTKVEQCGSGAAYAQVIDSIYGNVPMSKINFSAKHDYEFINNYKVLQDTFKRNKIDKPIPVDRLVRCKMQDNLEFLQWIKKFWDINYPGTPYDAEGRRAGQAAAPPPLHGAVTVGAARGTASRAPPASRTTGAAQTRRPLGGAPRAASASVPNETIQALTAQMDEMKVSVDSLEKERDFYFSKLRDIEIIVQERLAVIGDAQEQSPEAESETLKQIQAVLYSTEEGFEVPEGNEPPLDEEETF
ncbi:putative EB1-like protein [Violaceomyces palustris]|uniref:EB1-like protein n=1 Tax=Violaceomyces palustris TaxID=1673888 RepID=A0ACD0P8Z7_9BASI|nr:putative EB1-like protein [Violaceomyces palustris]